MGMAILWLWGPVPTKAGLLVPEEIRRIIQQMVLVLYTFIKQCFPA